MRKKSIAILSPGDMGHAVGHSLREHGHKVYTCLSGRSSHTHYLSRKAGIINIPSLQKLVSRVDLIMSILPPNAAKLVAAKVGAAMKETASFPGFIDCNAISPMTVKSIAKIINASGGAFLDAGIIGLAPGKEPGVGPRFYVSGPDTATMSSIDGCGLKVISLGKEIGRASSIKMCYAALTKGTMTLHTAVLMAAEKLGLSEELCLEFSHSQNTILSQMKDRVPRLPADAERWEGEMEQIAETFRYVNVPSSFHEGAAKIFSLLASTPYGKETRETMDLSRGLTEAIKVFVEYLPTNGESESWPEKKSE